MLFTDYYIIFTGRANEIKAGKVLGLDDFPVEYLNKGVWLC